MVDRITPGTTIRESENLEHQYGIIDRCPVHCEDFIQWIIEDKFCTSVPAFSKAGATLVKDIEPYELMKIRLLNGSHSALSYPSYLMNIRYVDEAIKDPDIGNFIRNHYMEEITATLPRIDGVDFSAYKDKLISRFGNQAIKDTILRLASDGSKKIANAIVKPLEEAIKKGSEHTYMVFALACWGRFLLGTDEQGKEIPIEDPMGQQLAQALKKSPRAFLELSSVHDLSKEQWSLLERMFSNDLMAIEKNGTRQALKDLLAT